MVLGNLVLPNCHHARGGRMIRRSHVRQPKMVFRNGDKGYFRTVRCSRRLGEGDWVRKKRVSRARSEPAPKHGSLSSDELSDPGRGGGHRLRRFVDQLSIANPVAIPKR